jgi:hypothetical protein
LAGSSWPPQGLSAAARGTAAQSGTARRPPGGYPVRRAGRSGGKRAL